MILTDLQNPPFLTENTEPTEKMQSILKTLCPLCAL
jgi:hypothetical protein